MNGAEIVIACLREQKVSVVFGYPGASNLPLYDAWTREGEGIRHVLPTHEVHGAFAADGYARTSGKVGVCFATSGPGATNLVTGIAASYMDSVPVVYITANVPRDKRGSDSFQEADIWEITMSITKHSVVVLREADLAEELRRAFFIAREGRPGPVLVDIPSDILSAECGEFAPLTEEELSAYYLRDPVIRSKQDLFFQRQKRFLNDEALDSVTHTLITAQRPLLLVGGGTIRSGAGKYVERLVRKLDLPCVSTFMGITALPAEEPRFLGPIGMYGNPSANEAARRADVILAVGVRFSDRTLSSGLGFAPDVNIIHVDIDRAEINKAVPSYMHVTADASSFLRALAARVPTFYRKKWWNARDCETGSDGNAAKILKAISEETPEPSRVVTDVGQHQVWTIQHYPFRFPGQLLTSGGTGTMGYGLGAAIGAAIAHPEETVTLVTGDGSFPMNLAELATLARERLRVIIVVMENRTLGMVRQWQKAVYDARYSETLIEPVTDYRLLASAYGLTGCYAQNPEEFRARYREALARDTASVIVCAIDPEEPVLPMGAFRNSGGV